MQITVTSAAAIDQTADVLVVGIPKDTKSLPKHLRGVDTLIGGVLARDIEAEKVGGKIGDTTWYHAPLGATVTYVCVAGIGDAADLRLHCVRKIAAVALDAAGSRKPKSLVVQLMHSGRKVGAPEAAGAYVEGTILATFNPTNWQTAADAKPTPIESLIVAEVPSKDLAKARKAVQRGEILAEAANTTKFLQNEPANAMTPSELAKIAKQIGKDCGLDVKVITKAQAEKLKMGSYLSVAQGSAQPPQFIVMTYTGRKSAKTTLALVGKGVTFDTGGISLKPAAGMEEMKYDMSGAANVIGAMKAIAQLKPKINVVGITPCTENMPSGSATKPGDIVTAMNGKTIEVINTDAEGRLILADALTYATEKAGATHIVDLATLTGACVIALGSVNAGAMTNDEAWQKKVLDAAEAAGEKLWPLPMDDHYATLIKSKIADVKNVGNREAGTITAAKFLEKFVAEGTPWVHLDIAGIAWVDSPMPGNPKGPTAMPMRTLVTLAESLT